jgi:hypothetical protein
MPVSVGNRVSTTLVSSGCRYFMGLVNETKQVANNRMEHRIYMQMIRGITTGIEVCIFKSNGSSKQNNTLDVLSRLQSRNMLPKQCWPLK